jgi:thiamine-phosphate pyrophosphorylase
MASQGKFVEPRRPVPRLYLVTPQADCGIAGPLGVALAAADIAAVLLRARDEETLLDLAKAVGPRIQEAGTALLLDGYPEQVAAAGADGAHVSGVDACKSALALLKPDRIAGCGALSTRHEAMLAGEAGADYVMFGEPWARRGRPPFAAIAERVAWWDEVFEIPCVGFAGSLDEVEPLAAAGADFVAVGDFIFADSRGCGAALADAARRLAPGERAA